MMLVVIPKRIKISSVLIITTFILIFNLHYFRNQYSFGHYSPIRDQSCKPKSNIVFLKTHKCASSSIQNILMRYGYMNKKVFVLPAFPNYLGHPQPFNSSMVPHPHVFGHEYNILTHHARFNYTSMKSLMPNNTIFITILRNPVHLFESAYHYYNLDAFKFYNFTLEQIDDPHFQFPKDIFEERFLDIIGINQMMFDLGLEMDEMNNREIVTDYIKQLDQKFDLVMITERMSESLILLKHLLCWQTEDVIVFKLNARKPDNRSNLTDISRTRIKELNWADHLLYQYFDNKLNTLIDTFGVNNMRLEVEGLNRKTNIRMKECKNGNERILEDSNKGNCFNNSNTCWMLSEKEINFTNLLRERQIQMYPKSVFQRNETM